MFMYGVQDTRQPDGLTNSGERHYDVSSFIGFVYFLLHCRENARSDSQRKYQPCQESSGTLEQKKNTGRVHEHFREPRRGHNSSLEV